MKKFTAAFALMLVASFNAEAITLDFNSMSDNQYWINSTSSQGFTETMGANQGGNIGLVTHTDGYGNSNGTVSLISWTNGGSQSGFTLTSNTTPTFSLSSFDFANGYPNFSSAVSSINMLGTYLDNTTINQSFNASWGSTNFVNLVLSPLFTNVKSVLFTANGSNNRAVWDNIVVNEQQPNQNNVPEPAVLALLTSGLFYFGVVRRRAIQL